MGLKNKNDSAQRPNAPDFRVLQEQQPPQNPYYQDSSAALLSSPPPPYSDLTVPLSSANIQYPNVVPMSSVNTTSNISYPRTHDRNPGHVPIVIHSNAISYDRRADRYNRKVRSFNNQTMLIAILVALTSAWAYNLYESRPCIYGFTVHQPSKDVTITIRDVRDTHLQITYLSCFVVFLCLVKAVNGFNSKSYSCYLLLMALVSFAATCVTGYLAYLAFWSPCAINFNELVSQGGKTLISKIFGDKLPGPEKRVFDEQNVINLASDDRNGALIFILDVVNCVFYASVFLASTIMC